jgi:hypothetical protein
MLPLMEMVCYRFMLPLYVTPLSYPRQYATTLGNRLSSYLPWYATAYGNGVSLPNPSNRCTYSQERLVNINKVTFKASVS